MGIKTVVYMATRNMDRDLVPAVNSVAVNGNIDKVYMLIEDDIFPYPLPDIVEVRNVSDQKYFDPSGPNYNCHWTYMVMMKAALHREFPELDKILILDVDTIVNHDISELWDIDLSDYYLTAVTERWKSELREYFNLGVAFLNLDKLRAGKGDEMIAALNARSYGFVEQDCYNEKCRNKIYELDPTYNSNNFTRVLPDPKITHFAGFPSRIYNKWPVVQKYMIGLD